MIKIEFFHDVICSFCFPMSARMRKIAAKYNNIEIDHRSFALGWEAEDFIRSFGSREAVKPEVLGHWVQANKNDDEHRFNIEGMRQTDFNFPISKPALKAAKAAGIVGGEAVYWDVFDRLQNKLFVENKNIEDIAVLEEAVKETSISFADWKAQFEKEETEKAVLADLQLAQSYGVNSAPTLVINRKYAITGAQSQEHIEEILAKISQDEGIPLNKLLTFKTDDPAGSCSIVDDKWQCD
ncbi:DsbA family oxidoreductase [Amphibacillus indicireducens]|uniref:DsbA family protein n=1 Tax=Amphibacillus indicireducens TaxID=1076330 RepID=A0ABP7W4F3_9BACI